MNLRIDEFMKDELVRIAQRSGGRNARVCIGIRKVKVSMVNKVSKVR